METLSTIPTASEASRLVEGAAREAYGRDGWESHRRRCWLVDCLGRLLVEGEAREACGRDGWESRRHWLVGLLEGSRFACEASCLCPFAQEAHLPHPWVPCHPVPPHFFAEEASSCCRPLDPCS